MEILDNVYINKVGTHNLISGTEALINTTTRKLNHRLVPDSLFSDAVLEFRTFVNNNLVKKECTLTTKSMIGLIGQKSPHCLLDIKLMKNNVATPVDITKLMIAPDGKTWSFMLDSLSDVGSYTIEVTTMSMSKPVSKSSPLIKVIRKLQA